nr:NAC domain-containing protein 35 [Ipomoea batatas]
MGMVNLLLFGSIPDAIDPYIRFSRLNQSSDMTVSVLINHVTMEREERGCDLGHGGVLGVGNGSTVCFPKVEGKEAAAEHEHDIVMPGFRFHPAEEELVEFNQSPIFSAHTYIP